MTKFELINGMQACINSYRGKHGQVVKIYDAEDFFEVKNCSGFFGVKENKLAIVFTGSESDDKKYGDLDWHYNFDFKKICVPYENVNPEIQVHEGFINMYKMVRDIVLSKAQSYQDITVMGHSLGAALATIAAVDINYKWSEKIITVITAGSPKVGNKFFAESYDRRLPNTYRVVNSNDFVTKVPYDVMGYQHVGKKIQIGYANIFFDIPVIRLIGAIDHYPQKYKENMIYYKGNI